ncbi:short-chain dehydrogenase/reductase family protein [Aspergillus heteromorphus CBS 117.55]|uniref:Short-chain dehydrogenase/reductase family protein n=1 Tax=Aspergillus heteromorphus CBS 117.55 TaxID=1448321 RepID=A0A317WE00_9EURO|nr:short-chain dehydrogenase/reductase family protein [Aspergillus heteromorphus CBS 117.55]PWY83452.1 short-chain dehydrogenase/reductase family protein [Aspergillus heteromorphus CBS 117.55]
MLLKALLRPTEFYSSLGPTVNELTFGLLGYSFKPERDIEDLSGKVILVTGGNTGLGKETILQLARHNPARIYLAARSATKAQDAITSIREQFPSVDLRHIPLDLSSFQSIRAAAEKFTADSDRLDILILNAGIMNTPAAVTEEGFEIQFGTNHIGHFLLTKLLLPTLQKTVASSPASDVRVVTLSSVAHIGAPSFEAMTSTSALLANRTFTRYSASKAANILFASELARRHPEILSVSVHPGSVVSDLWNYTSNMSTMSKYSTGVIMQFSRSIRTGAMNQLWAAGVNRGLLTNGAYYVPIGVHAADNPLAKNAGMAKRLWEWTEQQIAEKS